MNKFSLTLGIFVLTLCHCSCTKKSSCPAFESNFLDFYVGGHNEEVVFKNLSGPSEMIMIVYKMRVDHVSDLRQNAINGKSGCQCWSKMSFGFGLPDRGLEYDLVLNVTDGVTYYSMNVAIENQSGLYHEYYDEYDTAAIVEIIESNELPLENYLIFSHNKAALVFEEGVGVVLLRFEDGDTWVIKEIPEKRTFDWNNMHYEEFEEDC